MRETRRALKRAVETAAKQEQRILLQQNPFFPDLLNQPDIVLVPRLGRLVAIYLYAPTSPINWRSVLTAIEDLFELKTSVQQSAVAIALQDVTRGVSHASINAVELLGQMFDLLVPVNEQYSSSERLIHELRLAIRNIQPKDDLFQLWAGEKERMSEQLARFSEERYAVFVDQRRPSVQQHEELLSQLAIDADTLGLDPHREVLVRTPKEPIGGLRERSRFSFDLAVRDRRGMQLMIDLVSSGRYGARPFLRYQMTKARFTSYEPLKPGEPFRLTQRREPLRRVLLVDGNLAGPKHDPYRYVRALVSVGWEIERAERQVLPRLINANVQEGN